MTDTDKIQAADLDDERCDEHPFITDLRAQISEEFGFYQREEGYCSCYATNPRKDHLYYNARQNKRFVSLFLSYANDRMRLWDRKAHDVLFAELLDLLARLKKDEDFGEARGRILDALKRALAHENDRLSQAQ